MHQGRGLAVEVALRRLHAEGALVTLSRLGRAGAQGEVGIVPEVEMLMAGTELEDVVLSQRAALPGGAHGQGLAADVLDAGGELQEPAPARALHAPLGDGAGVGRDVAVDDPVLLECAADDVQVRVLAMGRRSNADLIREAGIPRQALEVHLGVYPAHVLPERLPAGLRGQRGGEMADGGIRGLHIAVLIKEKARVLRVGGVGGIAVLVHARQACALQQEFRIERQMKGSCHTPPTVDNLGSA